MEIVLEGTVNLLAKSYNDMYVPMYSKKRNKKWTFTKTDVKDYKKLISSEVATILYNLNLPMLKENPTDVYRLDLEFFIDLYFKNKKPRKKDASNFIKPVEDSISETITVDDSYNFYVTSRKLDFQKHLLNEPLIYFRVS